MLFVRRYLLLAAVLLAWSCLATAPGEAAEIHFRRQCQVDGAVVRLGDVAGIYSTDKAESAHLAAIELFAAPAATSSKAVSARTIQDLLQLRGVRTSSHQFTGFSETLVKGSTMGDNAGDAMQTRQALTPSVVRAANERVESAVVDFLRHNVAKDDPWQAKLRTRLSAEQMQRLAHATAVAVRGGAEPWTGSQQYVLTVRSVEGALDLPIDADVELAIPAVVALRPLTRGDVVHEDDVTVKTISPTNASQEIIHSIEEIVGKEVVRPLVTGQPIPARSVQAPVLVRRGDVVTVYALSAGVRVRSNARARESGALGDLIELESLVDRKRPRFVARVSDFQTAEIFAQPTSARSSRSR
jgi:flagella basal body P-ring formation protein FlgA